MKSARVQLYGMTGKYAVIDTEATSGATVGENLKWPDGSTVTVAQLKAVSTPAASASQDIGTSDDVIEGQYNLYFNPKRAQDAVGSILMDSESVDFTYDATASTIKADVRPTGIAAGTYGEDLRLLVVRLRSDGRIDQISETALVPGNGISFDIDPITGAVSISVNGFVNNYRVTRDGNQRVTRDGNLRVTR